MLLDNSNTSKVFQIYKNKLKIILDNKKSRYRLVNTVYSKIFKDNAKEENSKEKEKIHLDDCLDEVGMKSNYPSSNFCQKPLSNSVIKMTTRFQKILGFEVKNPEKCVSNFSSKQKSYEKYILLAFFLIETSKGDDLLRNEEIDKLFDIREYERKRLKEKLVKIKFLIKINRTQSIINKEHELYLKYQQEIVKSK